VRSAEVPALENLLQQLVNGVAWGGIYALIALGYTMVYGVLKLINFAHGEVYMVGAMTGYYAAHAFGVADTPSLGGLLLTLVAAMTVCAVLAAVIERVAYRPLRSAPRLAPLITAIGVSSSSAPIPSSFRRWWRRTTCSRSGASRSRTCR
jgi:branched-chain amino acid transport system permease protein